MDDKEDNVSTKGGMDEQTEVRKDHDDGERYNEGSVLASRFASQSGH